MQLLIVAVGHKMPRWIEDGFAEYAKRMPPELRIELREINRSNARAAAPPPPSCSSKPRASKPRCPRAAASSHWMSAART
ncbi:conserved hypothetical protein (partial sequence n terminus) [Ralstonia solanacearum IPO1609]|uniref:Uncharacterized protein n=1 Tax=Ralstonia solanacearum IPO1609 TaxID=564066 RepID=A0ABF7RDY3_RALSL|nr:conserved hypothetical protein (partial sequence n terminus) [Ralstonia solanacearum IPO1609]